MYQMLPKQRCRNITGLVYKSDAYDHVGLYENEPHGDSWYSDLCGYMASRHVPCAVSPVHVDPYDTEDIKKWIERHLDPKTGELAEKYKDKVPKVGDKRPEHAHVMVCWPGSKSRDQMTELMADYCHIRPTMWEEVKNVPAMLRYFCHLDCDDPSKLKYPITELHAYGGLDISPLLTNDQKFKKAKMLLEVTDYVINESHFHHYNQLVKWAHATGDMELLSFVAGRAPYFAAYFKGESDERAEKAAKEKKEKESSENGSTE